MLTGTFDVAHICGKGNLDPTLDKTPGYTQVEFLDKELPDVLAAADLVLSRAGSNALMEFQALARPLLLVPRAPAAATRFSTPKALKNADSATFSCRKT